MKPLQPFIDKWTGKKAADQFGLFRGQCVSLVKQFLIYQGWPMRRGNAIQWQFNGYGGYHFWYNTPTFLPHPGDLAVFSTGPYGHIGIVVRADLKHMDVFNQNLPLGSPAHMTTFDYIHPHSVGFLRKV